MNNNPWRPASSLKIDWLRTSNFPNIWIATEKKIDWKLIVFAEIGNIQQNWKIWLTPGFCKPFPSTEFLLWLELP